MKTFKILYDFEYYYAFEIKGVELFSKMPDYSPRFDANPRSAGWVTPDGSFYPTSNYVNEKVAIPSITTWVTGNLILNARAYNCLAEKLAAAGEFLDLAVEGLEYHMFNTLFVIDEKFIDTTHARKLIDGGIDAGLENVSFSTEGLHGQLLFKSPSDHLLHSYCTEEFVELLHAQDLHGLLFEEVVKDRQ